MQIGELNHNLSGRLDEIVEAGAPVLVTKYGRDQATIVPTDLWNEILRVPSVRKRIKEYTAAKQAAKQDGLSEVA